MGKNYPNDCKYTLCKVFTPPLQSNFINLSELYSHLLCGSLQSCQVLGSFEKVKLVIRERGSRMKTVGKSSSSKKCSWWSEFPFSCAGNLVLHLTVDYMRSDRKKLKYFILQTHLGTC